MAIHVGLEECGLGNGLVGGWGLGAGRATWIGRSCGAPGTGAGPCRTPPFCASNGADEAPLPPPASSSAAWSLLSDQFGIAQQPTANSQQPTAPHLTPWPRSSHLRLYILFVCQLARPSPPPTTLAERPDRSDQDDSSPPLRLAEAALRRP
jgi:hypothetical protein